MKDRIDAAIQDMDAFVARIEAKYDRLESELVVLKDRTAALEEAIMHLIKSNVIKK